MELHTWQVILLRREHGANLFRCVSTLRKPTANLKIILSRANVKEIVGKEHQMNVLLER